MAETMIASTISDGQIENTVAKLRDALRTHRGEFDSEAVQQVLGTDNLGMRLLEPFRVLVEAISDLIIRRVTVDRSLTPQAALKATGRRQYVTDEVVASMPQGEGDEAKLIFVKSDRYRTDPEVDALLAEHGLVQADPHELAAFNAANPEFADDHPNSTHWQDADGKWCYIAFDRWRDERNLRVRRHDYKWDGLWWFAGRCK